jgi:hypothetical protein
MSYDLLPSAGNGQFYSGEQRRTGQTVSRLHSGGMIRQTSVDIEGDVIGAKIDAISMETARGLNAVCRVAQAQTALEQLVPQASGRLNVIADAHVLAVAETLDDLNYRLRRL